MSVLSGADIFLLDWTSVWHQPSWPSRISCPARAVWVIGWIHASVTRGHPNTMGQLSPCSFKLRKANHQPHVWYQGLCCLHPSHPPNCTKGGWSKYFCRKCKSSFWISLRECQAELFGLNRIQIAQPGINILNYKMYFTSKLRPAA